MWSQPYAVRAEPCASQTWVCGSSQSRGRNIRTMGHPSSNNPFTQTLPISQDLHLWNFPRNWKEDQMLWLDIKSYGNAALGNVVKHRDTENLCGEGTARYTLLSVGQPSEKETGFKILTQTCMHHNLEKLCTEMDDKEGMYYAQKQHSKLRKGSIYRVFSVFSSCSYKESLILWYFYNICVVYFNYHMFLRGEL